MGVAYYVVSHERRELFELGKGPWELIDFIAPGVEHRDVDAFCARFADVWSSRNSNRDYALGVARRLWEWCERCQWEVEVRHDWEPEGLWLTYPQTGSRYGGAA